MSEQLPDNPNLERLRKQAKVRLSELRKEHPESKLAEAPLPPRAETSTP